MVMLLFSCDAETARDFLMTYSQHRNQSVRHIALSVAEDASAARLSGAELAADITWVVNRPNRQARQPTRLPTARGPWPHR